MVNTTCCAVARCGTSPLKHKDLKFHQFPRDERTHLWVEACKREDLKHKELYQLKYKFICSLHFEPQMYGKRLLKRSAVPTLNLPTVSTTPAKNSYTQTDEYDPKSIEAYKNPRVRLQNIGVVVNPGSPGVGVQTDDFFFDEDPGSSVQAEELQSPVLSNLGNQEGDTINVESFSLKLQSNILIKLEPLCILEQQKELEKQGPQSLNIDSDEFLPSTYTQIQSQEHQFENLSTSDFLNLQSQLINLESTVLDVNSDRCINPESIDVLAERVNMDSTGLGEKLGEYINLQSTSLDVNPDEYINLESTNLDVNPDEYINIESTNLDVNPDEYINLESTDLDVNPDEYINLESTDLDVNPDEYIHLESTDLDVNPDEYINIESTSIDINSGEHLNMKSTDLDEKCHTLQDPRSPSPDDDADELLNIGSPLCPELPPIENIIDMNEQSFVLEQVPWQTIASV